VFIDQQGRPVHLNQRAERLADDPDSGIKISPHRINLVSDNAVLQRLIQQTNAGHGGGVMKFTHPVTFKLFSLMIMPINSNRIETRIDVPHAVAAIFINEINGRSNIDLQALIAAYGLTPREAQIAVDISNGMSLEEISQASHTSLHTVRTQLKSIFRKTDTARQTELLRLLLNSVFTCSSPET
jgi:DNA-binding CsgD family transcriptional regulator